MFFTYWAIAFLTVGGGMIEIISSLGKESAARTRGVNLA